MYCNFTVEIKDVTFVITEMVYVPESKETFRSPYQPDEIHILRGYAMEGVNEVDFWDAVADYEDELHEAAMKWYKEDDNDRRVDGLL